jgi:hypothetical protein
MVPAKVEEGDERRDVLGGWREAPNIATVTEEGTVIDLEGRPFSDAMKHGRARTVAASSANQLLAIGHEDGTITLWDVGSRSRLGEPLLGDNAPVTALGFASGETELVSRDGEGVVLRWPVGRDAWRKRACKLAVVSSLARNGWRTSATPRLALPARLGASGTGSRSSQRRRLPKTVGYVTRH